MESAWRFAEGEEARLTSDGALIMSRGTLPLRVRTEGQSYLRPQFPGTAVRLGDAHYEVVAEEGGLDGVTYHLRPWPHDHVLRDIVVYDHHLILAVLRERRGAEERARARSYAWLLYPIVGFLPEARQLRACDRYGLQPAIATLFSGSVELLAALVLGRLGGSVLSFFVLPLIFGLALPATLRMTFALVFREVEGWWVLVIAERLSGVRAVRPRRLDATILPLTRDAFWARLAQADRHEEEPGGTVLVTSTLAHLTWDANRRLLSPSGDWWLASVLPSYVERGRLFYRYRLTALRMDGEEGRAAEPPSTRSYQDDVAERIAREWDDLLLAGAWLASALPAAVQHRAFGPRGGPKLIAGKAKLTAAFEIVVGTWLLVSGLVWTRLGFMDLISVGLVAEGILRFRMAGQREYAPSVFGSVVADLLRPERVEYQAHRDAEREALAERPE